MGSVFCFSETIVSYFSPHFIANGFLNLFSESSLIFRVCVHLSIAGFIPAMMHISKPISEDSGSKLRNPFAIR